MIEALSITMRQGFLLLCVQEPKTGEKPQTFLKERKGNMKIHLIEPLNNFTKLRDNVWENGCWKMKENIAEKLIGGEIYFHKKREEPSFYGGTILGCRMVQEGPDQGKIIFEFQYSVACRNIRTDRLGWSLRMKIIQEVGEEEPPAKTSKAKQKKMSS